LSKALEDSSGAFFMLMFCAFGFFSPYSRRFASNKKPLAISHSHHSIFLTFAIARMEYLLTKMNSSILCDQKIGSLFDV